MPSYARRVCKPQAATASMTSAHWEVLRICRKISEKTFPFTAGRCRHRPLQLRFAGTNLYVPRKCVDPSTRFRSLRMTILVDKYTFSKVSNLDFHAGGSFFPRTWLLLGCCRGLIPKVQNKFKKHPLTFLALSGIVCLALKEKEC